MKARSIDGLGLSLGLLRFDGVDSRLPIHDGGRRAGGV